MTDHHLFLQLSFYPYSSLNAEPRFEHMVMCKPVVQ